MKEAKECQKTRSRKSMTLESERETRKIWQRRTVDLLVLVVAIFNAANIHACLVGKNDTSGCKPLVTGKNDRIKHALVEQEVSHPFADDNVHLVDGQGHLFDFSLDAFNSYLIQERKGEDKFVSKKFVLVPHSAFKNDVRSENPLSAMIWRAVSRMSEASTAKTRAAPAWQANMLKMPVPQPTSSTTY